MTAARHLSAVEVHNDREDAQAAADLEALRQRCLALEHVAPFLFVAQVVSGA